MENDEYWDEWDEPEVMFKEKVKAPREKSEEV